MYDQLHCEYPNSKSVEETLKDWLWKTLNELKMSTLNEEGWNRVILQADDVLKRLRNIDTYATCNILVTHLSSRSACNTMGTRGTSK